MSKDIEKREREIHKGREKEWEDGKKLKLLVVESERAFEVENLNPTTWHVCSVFSESVLTFDKKAALSIYP